MSKCAFAQRKVDYFRHVISGQGLATDPLKIAAIQHWPTPTNVKQLRSFLGSAGYYRKFIKNFGVICKPMTKLLKKKVVFVWSNTHEHAFTVLKTALVQAPVLALPDYTKQFQLETYASEGGVGVVLMQECHPLAFIIKD
jgi:hypothetical protein